VKSRLDGADLCGSVTLVDHWTNNQQKLIWLFRLDSLGGVIWSQTYATDTIFVDEWSHSLLKISDSNCVITAETYYPDSTFSPNNYILKILLIKVNINGVALLTIPWGTNNGVVSDGRISVADLHENLYSSGRRARTISPAGDSPCLFKTSSNGQPAFYKDLKTTCNLGTGEAINWFQDSSLAIVAQWRYANDIDTTGVIKTDINGNTLNIKNLTTVSNCSIYGSGLTFNNRLIL